MNDARRKKPLNNEVSEQEPEQEKQEESSPQQEKPLSLEQDGSIAHDNKEVSNTGEPQKPAKKWYVVRVQSGREDRVQSNIEKRVKDLGLEQEISKVLVPKELITEIRKNVKRVVERKLYPGYVIVEMVMTEELHYTLRSIPGVGEIAGEMSESEAERLLLACDHGKDKPKPKVAFQKGQIIKIKEGPFEDYDGIVDEVNEQRGIIKVRIEIFGRHTQVELGYWQVESV